MEDVRKRFIRSVVERLVELHGREEATDRLRKAARRSFGVQRKLTLDMLRQIEGSDAAD